MMLGFGFLCYNSKMQMECSLLGLGTIYRPELYQYAVHSGKIMIGPDNNMYIAIGCIGTPRTQASSF
jgi:hypothetical protein